MRKTLLCLLMVLGIYTQSFAQDPCANDTEPPTFNCPIQSASLQYGPNECTFTLGDFGPFYVRDVEDNCTASPTVVQSLAPGTLIDLPPGSIFQLTYSVTDEAGNTNDNCSITVEVVDLVAPVFDNCPGDQNPAVSNCSYELPDYVSTLGITATDNCTAAGDITYIQTPAVGTTISSTTEVTITAIDAAGGQSDCDRQL